MSATDYVNEMRILVQELSIYAKSVNPNFKIIPQNGQAIVTSDATVNGTTMTDFMKHVDAWGIENTFYDFIPVPNPADITPFTTIAMANNIRILGVDYINTTVGMSDSMAKNTAAGYLAYQVPDRVASLMQPGDNMSPKDVNANNITNISEAKNFLYLLSAANYPTAEGYIQALSNNNYDMIIMSFPYDTFTAGDINRLRVKANGGRRLVIAYISAAMASNFTYFWQPNWVVPKPSLNIVGYPAFLCPESIEWPGAFWTHYWDPEWKRLIYDNPNVPANPTNFMKRIIDAGFDGAYLDMINAWMYFKSGGQE